MLLRPTTLQQNETTQSSTPSPPSIVWPYRNSIEGGWKVRTTHGHDGYRSQAEHQGLGVVPDKERSSRQVEKRLRLKNTRGSVLQHRLKHALSFIKLLVEEQRLCSVTSQQVCQ